MDKLTFTFSAFSARFFHSLSIAPNSISASINRLFSLCSRSERRTHWWRSVFNQWGRFFRVNGTENNICFASRRIQSTKIIFLCKFRCSWMKVVRRYCWMWMRWFGRGNLGELLRLSMMWVEVLEFWGEFVKFEEYLSWKSRKNN